MDRFHRTFLSGEKVIGWNVCQTHSKLVAASLAKSVPATDQANCCSAQCAKDISESSESTSLLISTSRIQFLSLFSVLSGQLG